MSLSQLTANRPQQPSTDPNNPGQSSATSSSDPKHDNKNQSDQESSAPPCVFCGRGQGVEKLGGGITKKLVGGPADPSKPDNPKNTLVALHVDAFSQVE